MRRSSVSDLQPRSVGTGAGPFCWSDDARVVTPPLAPFVDQLPAPSRLALEHDGRLTVRIRTGEHRFHRDLPASSIWGFDGTVPGPTIEAERGQAVTVEWRNELEGAFPVFVTVAPEAIDADGVPVQCLPGLSGGAPDAARGRAGRVTRSSTCTAVSPPPRGRLGREPRSPRVSPRSAATRWTSGRRCSGTTTTSWASPSFDVYAGLAGLWIVRDDRERDLGLPEGPPFEVPLLIQDRNFDVDDARAADRPARPQDRPGGDGGFPAIHGRERQGLAGPRRATGDLPLPRSQRLQRPHIPARAVARRRAGARADHADRDRPRAAPRPGARSDGRARARVSRARRPARRLLRSRARERADSYSTPPPHRSTAPRSRPQTPRRPPTSTDLLPYPQVLRFRVVGEAASRVSIPRELATDYEPPAVEALAGAPRRAIALVERELDGEPNMLTMRELAIAADADGGPCVTRRPTASETIRYRAVAAHFEDATTFFPMLGRVRGLAADQPHRRHAPDPPPPRPVPDPRAPADPLRDPRRRHRQTATSPRQSHSSATRTTSSTTRSTTTNAASRTPSASTRTRSSRSPSASPPTAAGTCTTATSSSTKTAT